MAEQADDMQMLQVSIDVNGKNWSRRRACA